jgi:hypothetical protein
MMSAKLKFFVLGVTLTVLLTSALGSAEDPAATKAYFAPMVIPAAAFVNDGQNPDGFDFRTGGIEGLGMSTEMVAPVYLPNGATVRGFRAYIFDNTNSCGLNREDVDIFLVRTSLVTGTSQTVAITASDGASGFVDYEPTHTLNSSSATVNNTSYQYWVHMRICSFSHRVNAVVIEF